MSNFEALARQKYKDVWKWSHFLCMHSDNNIYVVNLDQVGKEQFKFIDIEIRGSKVIGHINEEGRRVSFWVDVFELVCGNFGCIGMIKDGTFTHSSQIYYKISYDVFTNGIMLQKAPKSIIINNDIIVLANSAYKFVFDIRLNKIQSIDIINGLYYCIDYDFTLIDNWLIAADGRRFRLMGMAPDRAHLASPQEIILLQKLMPATLPPSLILDNPADYAEIFEVNNIWLGRHIGAQIQALSVRSVNAGKNTKPPISDDAKMDCPHI